MEGCKLRSKVQGSQIGPLLHGSHEISWRSLANCFVILARRQSKASQIGSHQRVAQAVLARSIIRALASRAGCHPVCSIKGALGLIHELQRHDLIAQNHHDTIHLPVCLGQPSLHRQVHRISTGHNLQIITRVIASAHLHFYSAKIELNLAHPLAFITSSC